MEYRTVKYQFLNQDSTIVAKIDDDDVSRLSCSIENPEYLAGLAEGNTPEPYVPPPAPPVTEVTALQGLLAIDHAGLSVEYTVWANSPLRTFAQKAFINKAQTWKRNDPTLIAAATELGLSDGQLDALFTLASNL